MLTLQEIDLTSMDIASSVFNAEQIAQVLRQDTYECIEFSHRMEDDSRIIYIDYQSRVYKIHSHVTVEKSLELLLGKFQPLEYINTIEGHVETSSALLHHSWDDIYENYNAVQFTIMPYTS